MKKNSLMNSLFGILPPLFFDKPSAGGAVENQGDASGEGAQLTGVARYLQKLEPKIEDNLTGVARYLAQQQALEEANRPVVAEPEAEEEVRVEEIVAEIQEPEEAEIVDLEPVLSGVDKYLSQQSENPDTRVAK